MDRSEHATQLLNRLAAGEREVEAELLATLYDELKLLAAGHMARERNDHTLQPTALVNEAWLRLFAEGRELSFEGRRQFYSLASRVMRTALVDHARAKKTEKRGGHAVVLSLDLELPTTVREDSPVDTLDLDAALSDLSAADPELGKLVEMRYFGGASVQVAADALGLSLRTAERRLQAGTLWLRERLDG